MRNKIKLYMAVSTDEFELPLFISEDIKEVATRYGITYNDILSRISNGRSGKTNGVKFIRIDVEDDESSIISTWN